MVLEPIRNPLVSLREKGVDLNILPLILEINLHVSLREKGVDLNIRPASEDCFGYRLPS